MKTAKMKTGKATRKVGAVTRAIRFKCGECGTRMEARVKDAGEPMPCPSCGVETQVPAAPPPSQTVWARLPWLKWAVLGGIVLMASIVSLTVYLQHSRLDAADFQKAAAVEESCKDAYETAIQAYQGYLAAHPKGNFADDARQKSTLDLPAKIAQRDSRKDEDCFRAARTVEVAMSEDVDHILARYHTYLTTFPKGRHGVEANQSIAQLELHKAEIDQFTAAEKLETDPAENYEAAIAAYQKILDDHPDGMFAARAGQKIKIDLPVKITLRDNQRDDHAFQVAVDAANASPADPKAGIRAYQAYLTAYPDGRHIDEAAPNMEALQTAAGTPAAVPVQPAVKPPVAVPVVAGPPVVATDPKPADDVKKPDPLKPPVAKPADTGLDAPTLALVAAIESQLKIVSTERSKPQLESFYKAQMALLRAVPEIAYKDEDTRALMIKTSPRMKAFMSANRDSIKNIALLVGKNTQRLGLAGAKAPARMTKTNPNDPNNSKAPQPGGGDIALDGTEAPPMPSTMTANDGQKVASLEQYLKRLRVFHKNRDIGGADNDFRDAERIMDGAYFFQLLFIKDPRFAITYPNTFAFLTRIEGGDMDGKYKPFPETLAGDIDNMYLEK